MEIRRSAAPSAAEARRPDPVRRAVLALDRAVRENQPRKAEEAVHAIDTLLAADHGPDDDRGRDLRSALARAQLWWAARARRRAMVVARLQECLEAGWLVDAELLRQGAGLVRDEGASEEERRVVATAQAELTRHSRARVDAAREARLWEEARAEKAMWAQIAAAREVLAAKRKREHEEREHQEQLGRQAQLADVAATVRGALKKAAREGRTSTWKDLQARTGQARIGRLGQWEQVEVLLVVDRDVALQVPLWSTLLAAGGATEALCLYRVVAHRLGRALPSSDAELVQQLAADRATLHSSR